MKNLNFKMAVVAIVTLFFTVLPAASRAQPVSVPNYGINNLSQTCSIHVTWKIYNSCPISSNSPCGSGSATIPANSTTVITTATSGCGFSICDLQITLDKIGMTSISPVPASSINFGTPVGIGGTTPCSSSGGGIMNWHWGSCDVAP